MALPSYITDSGAGTPVVLLHAFPLNCDIWSEQHRDLPFRVVSFDLPGFGRDTGLPEADSMSAYCDVLFSLLDAFSLDRVVLGGCSMGGYIAMEAMRHNPDRFSGFILANTRAGGDSEEAKANRQTQAADTLENGPLQLITAMREKLVGESTKKDNPALQDKLTSMMQSASPAGIASALRAMAARPDSTETLRSLHKPVCIIAGEEDQLIPASEARIMNEAVAGSELHIVESSGHLTCLEQPARFNEAVSGFISRIA